MDVDHVQGRHGQAGAVDHAADVAIQLDEGQAFFPGGNFIRILLFHVAEFDPFRLTEEGVVIQIDFAVEHHHIAGFGEYKRIDLRLGAVIFHENFKKLFHYVQHGIDRRGVAKELGGDGTGGLAREHQSVGAQGKNGIRILFGYLFDVHAAFGRGDKTDPLLTAVENHRHISFAINVRAVFNVEAMYRMPLDIHAENGFGGFAGFLGGSGDFDAACLAASADVDLSFDRDHTTEMFPGRHGLLDREGNLPFWNRQPVSPKNVFRLMFVNIHDLFVVQAADVWSPPESSKDNMAMAFRLHPGSAWLTKARMARKPRGLGRGLDALINELPASDADSAAAAQRLVSPTEISENPLQPRRYFDPEALEKLAASIREHGLLQPLVLREAKSGYELIAGERRFRAARLAKLTEIPVVIVEADDRAALELALIENLQREDLSIVEEAEGYQQLASQFGFTQEQIAERMGKGRATIANALRILNLSAGCRKLLQENKLTPGHAKVLLGLEKKSDQDILARDIVSLGLTVRDTEQRVAQLLNPKGDSGKPSTSPDPDLPKSYQQHLSDKLQQHFGSKVQLVSSGTTASGKKSRGKIEIEFYSNDDLDRVLNLMGIDPNR